MGRQEILTTRKVGLTVLAALAILVAAQSLAALVGLAVIALKLPVWLGNVMAAILYVVFTLLGIRILSGKAYGNAESEMAESLSGRIFCGKLSGIHRSSGDRNAIRFVWILSAFAMPMIVCVILILLPGHWENANIDSELVIGVLTGGVLNYGVAGGIVEEAVFRGVIMTAVEKRWNRTIAIVAPSVLFGIVHIIGSGMGPVSMLQVVVAGSMVGILFSLVTYASGNIWNSAVMHGIWNICMISGVLHIGTEAESETLFNYVLNTRSFWITGGEFGSEASVAAILVYGGFCVLAACWLRVPVRKNR